MLKYTEKIKKLAKNYLWRQETMKKSFLFFALAFLLAAFSTAHAGVLGTAGDYNAFIYGDMNVWTSDSQGRIAAGGNINMSNYGVGALASPAPYSLIGGGNVTFGPGSVWNGGIFAGEDLSIRNHYVQGDVTVNGNITYPAGGTVTGSTTQNAGAASPVDFDTEFNYLKGLSSSLSTMPVNGSDQFLWGSNLFLNGSDNVNFYNVSGSDLGNASVLRYFNGTDPIDDNQISIVNISFYEATSLTIQGVGVKGSILAPHADVNFNSAHIDGTLIANSLTGTGEFHKYEFDHDVPVVPEPISSTLFIVGGATLGFRNFRKKRKTA
jgi:choice-of-anchor A domain-containing protein